MKANYLLKNKSRFPYLKGILILMAVFLSGVAVFYLFDSIIISAMAPIWKTKNIIISGENVIPIIDRQTESGLIIATVLTHPPQTPYDVLIIDAGSNDSVTLDSLVSLPEGPVVGVISEVFSKKAKVTLLSTNGEETNAILERNNVPVTLVGVGGGNFKVVLPRDVAVEKGDRILSRDIASRLLAVVEDINIRPTDSFKEVLARSPLNIFSLRFVFVIPQ
jgi:cell shape-determining protein MreC